MNTATAKRHARLLLFSPRNHAARGFERRSAIAALQDFIERFREGQRGRQGQGASFLSRRAFRDVQSPAPQRLVIGPKGGGHGVAPAFSKLLIVEIDRTRIGSGSQAIAISGDLPR
jgi:hypothetical protein